MTDGAGFKEESESTTQVEIPDFLRPFITQATGTAGRSLRRLENLSGGDLVAGFTPEQEEAFRRAQDIADGGGDIIPTVQRELLGIGGGAGIEGFLPESVRSTLAGFGDASFLPESVRSSLQPGSVPSITAATLTGAQSGGLPAEVLSALRGVSGDDLSFLDPSSVAALRDLTGGADISPVATDEFGNIVEGEFIPASSRSTLESTASGDFLFGGEGFDAAVDAAVRAARPGILSTFGRAGAGGATGGLARTAIARSAIDAFAEQFGQERGRQLSAADRLAELGLADRSQRLDAAGRAADVGLANNQVAIDESRGRLGAADVLSNLGLLDRGQSIDAANLLGSLDLANRDQQVDAAGLLGELDLRQQSQNTNAAGLLADILGQERNRSLSSAGLLADLSNSERGRQLQALGLLPEAGLLDVNLLEQIGGQRQQLEQRLLSAPLEVQLQLLSAALGGVPISSLLGQSSEGSRSGFQLGFSET